MGRRSEREWVALLRGAACWELRAEESARTVGGGIDPIGMLIPTGPGPTFPTAPMWPSSGA